MSELIREPDKRSPVPETAISAPPLFIVGYFHTGTSLLQTILDRDDSLFVPPSESHFFQDLAQIRTEFPNLQDDAQLHDYVIFVIKLVKLGFFRHAVRGEAYDLSELGVSEAQLATIVTHAKTGNAARTHEEIFGLVMDSLALQAGKTRWLEKTPEHVYHLGEILTLWPDARIIEMVRDPRGTLASRKIRQSDEVWLSNKQQDAETMDGETNFDAVIDSLMWKQAVHAPDPFRRSHPASLLTVRYEDLAREPEVTIREICRFTGLTFTPDLLNVGWVNSATHIQADQQSQSGVSTAALEKWKKVLTPEEQYLIQTILRAEMDRYGYVPGVVDVSTRLRAPLVATKAVPSFMKRVGFNRPQRMTGRARAVLSRMQRNLIGS